MPPKKTEKKTLPSKPEKRAETAPTPAKKTRSAARSAKAAEPVSRPENGGKTQEPTTIEVRESKGTVIGSFNHVVNNFRPR